ncbi:MAG TPA: glycosyltransferase [Vicinamibacteria bacterium]|nr:glycosyltransferase [Vicinamibacteria bacterium]
MRSEVRQRLVGTCVRLLQGTLGERLGRRAARLHPALDAHAAYRRFLARETERLPDRVPDAGPFVSVLLPMFDAPIAALRAAIESVRLQTWPRFEVCVADGGPAGSAGARLVRELAAHDPRFRVSAPEANRGIGGNTGAALATARGEFVLFLDQDDVLAPDALSRLAGEAARDPTLDVVYSDKDNVTPWGDRYDPYFKPDWSPELLLSTNFLAHATLVRRELVLAAGGIAADLDGAQDWDLFLRLAERTDRIAHVPVVLYHWRSVASSAASSLDAKPYVARAAREALRRALERRGWPGRIPGEAPLRILASFERAPRISVVTRAEELTDARGELVLFQEPGFRPDSDDWAAALAFWALVPGVGAAGAAVHDQSGAIEHAGLAFTEARTLPLFSGAAPRRWTPLGLPGFVRNVSALGPGAWMTRRSVLESVGPGTSAFDYSRRARAAGLRCVVVPQAVLVRTAGTLELVEPFETRDPYFNPNLDPASPVPRPRED